MDFRTFYNQLKEDGIRPSCLLYGREQFLVEWAKNSIISAYTDQASLPFDVTRLDGAQTGVEQILESCETLPFFSKRHIVLVEDFRLLEGEKNKNIQPQDEALLYSYLQNPARTTLLVFTCGEKPDKRRRLFKALQKNGSLFEFGKLSPRDLRKWAAKRFHSYGKQIGEKELSYLIEMSGYLEKESAYTLYHFDQDISKVVLHGQGKTVSKEDVDTAVHANISANVFQLADYVSRGEKKQAFALLSDLFMNGESEFGLLALLCRQYESLYQVRLLWEKGAGEAEIASHLEMKGFLVEKHMKLAGRYTSQGLSQILEKLYRTDRDIKNGDINGKMAIELLIATL